MRIGRRSARCSMTSTRCWTSTPQRGHRAGLRRIMAKHGRYFRRIRAMWGTARFTCQAGRGRRAVPQQPHRRTACGIDALSQQAFGSPQLMTALSRLDSHLRSARPGEDWTGSAEFSGDNRSEWAGGPRAGRHRRAGAALPSSCHVKLSGRDDGRRRPRRVGPAARR